MRSGASGGQIDNPIKEDGSPFEPADIQDVITMNLDFFITKFADTFPEYIKIDVDGNELKIIEGMQKTLRDTRLKSLLIEVNPRNTDLDDARYLRMKVKEVLENLK